MAKRYVGGILGAYHFSENFAAEGALLYAPDLGSADLKDLTHTLVGIAHEGSGKVAFQQPVDKMILGATFAARWAPVYGKINLIGERVLNFDFYGTAGLGLLTINKYYAKYNESVGVPPTELVALGPKPRVPVNLGVGFDFFLSSSLALKLDARNYLYVDNKPQYDPNVPVTESRLYNNFVASVGMSIFFPKMKPRVYNF
jgi:outer membrane beta-barrel protein